MKIFALAGLLSEKSPYCLRMYYALTGLQAEISFGNKGLYGHWRLRKEYNDIHYYGQLLLISPGVPRSPVL